MRARAVTVVGTVVFALLAAGAWWLFGGARTGSDRDEFARGADGRSPDERPAGRDGTALEAAPREKSASAAQARGGCLVVGVVRRDGHPVPARVEARVHSPYRFGAEDKRAERNEGDPLALSGRPPAAVADAGADGRFAVEGLRPGEYALIAIGAAPAGDPAGATESRGLAYATVAVEGARAAVDIDLEPAGYSLEVRARNEDGTPWRTRLEARSLAPATAETDERGIAVLHGLAGGNVWVAAYDEGLRVDANAGVPAKGPLEIVRPGRLVAMSGRVLDATDDAAIAGAQVHAYGLYGAANVYSEVTSAADGAFTLRVAPTTEWLFAKEAAHADAKIDLHGVASGLVLRMRRLARVTGTVVEAGTTRGVPGVRVLLGKPDEWNSRRPFAGRLRDDVGVTETDTQGRFAIDVDAVGPVETVAIGAGWCSKEVAADARGSAAIVDVAAGGSAVVTLEVVRAARVTGVVVDGAGRPAAGAIVRATDRAITSPHGPGWDDSGSEAGPASSTAPDGHFVLDVVPGVDVEVAARAGTLRSSAVPVGRLASGASKEVSLRLPRTRTLVVHVIEELGSAPVSGAVVMLSSDFDGWRTEKTDARGLVTFRDVSEGLLHINPPQQSGDMVFVSWNAADVPAAPPGEGPLPDVEITIRGDGVHKPPAGDRGADPDSIEGLVRFEDGSPAVGADVAASSGDEQLGAGTADLSGRFRVQARRGSELRVTATAKRLGAPFEAAAEARAGERDVVLVLRPSKRPSLALVVRVLGPDGRPVAAATTDVVIEQGGRRSTMERDVADGVLEIDAAERAETITVDLTIHDAKAADGSPLPVARFHVEGVPAATFPKEIRLTPERTIEGVVRRADGAPVSGVEVGAARAKEREGEESEEAAQLRLAMAGFVQPEFVSRTRSRADGTFRIGGLDDGEFVVAPVLEGDGAYVTDDGRETKARAGAKDVVVTLRPAVSALVRVLGPDGAPVDGATISSRREVKLSEKTHEWFDALSQGWSGALTGSRSRRKTDAGGNARVAGLDPEAAYEVSIEPPGTEMRRKRVTGWKPSDLTVRLDSSASTRGVVRSARGETLSAVTVVASRAAAKPSDADRGDARPVEVSTGDDGTFEFRDLPAGDVDLVASYYTDPDSAVAKARVPAGSQDVVMTLDPGAEIRARLEPASSQRVFVARDDAEPMGMREMRKTSDGTLRLCGLRADASYTVFTDPEGSRPAGFASGVRPSREVVPLVLAPSKRITVHWAADAAMTYVSAHARRGPVAASSGGSAPTLVLDGLAPGRWKLEVRGSGPDDAEFLGTAEAEAGGEVTVRLEPASK